jgi:hypothetical protein
MMYIAGDVYNINYKSLFLAVKLLAAQVDGHRNNTAHSRKGDELSDQVRLLNFEESTIGEK